MSRFIVMSPCNEPLRYGPDIIKRQVIDAHTAGKLAKFVVGWQDLKDPSKPPTRDNFRFQPHQVDDPDIVIFVDEKRNRYYLKGRELDV